MQFRAFQDRAFDDGRIERGGRCHTKVSSRGPPPNNQLIYDFGVYQISPTSYEPAWSILKFIQ